MALTKVQTIGIETGISLTGVTTVTTLNASTDTLSVGGTVNFGGNVSIAGTLTYEDVTNIDAVGLITARSGVKFGESGTTVFGNSTGIGIGEASPTRKLVVTGDTNTVAVVRGATNGTSSLFLGDSDDEDIGALTYNHPSNYLAITVNASERLRIDSSGTAEFTSNAAVNGSELGSRTLRLLDSGTSDAMIYGANSGSLSIQGGASQPGSGITLLGKSASTDPGTIKFFTTTASNDIASAERMRIDSSGNMGLGESAPDQRLHVKTSSDDVAKLESTSGGNGPNLTFAHTGASPADDDTVGKVTFSATNDNSQETTFADIKVISTDVSDGSEDGEFTFSTRNNGTFAERMRIDSSGKLGLGITSPALKLHVDDSGSQIIRFSRTGVGAGSLDVDSSGNAVFNSHTTSKSVAFHTQATERMRIDSDGRLLLGVATSSSVGFDHALQVEGTSGGNASLSIIRNSNDDNGPNIDLASTRGTSTRSNTIVQSGDTLGNIVFRGADGTDKASIAASINGQVDGTPGSNDMPGRLVFKTTADGASSPTERMRILSDGHILLHKTSLSIATQGHELRNSNFASHTVSGGVGLRVNRLTNDGDLIQFYQATVQEGSISVSGTTVSYNGAHLSRWSQLPIGAERTEILRGSVLSNLDEMCEWGEEDNEQLNRMKISNVEGDRNVSGVFQDWDDDDDTYTNDFYCAMTGDFVIRIAQGTTVARGDLLMSAGDGTAKPQDDDIVRSKTIAKVTSTTVSTTYSDGSYCVPCVLMAC